MAMIPARNRKRMQEGGEAEQTNVVQNPYAGTIPTQKTTLTPEETVQSIPLVEQPTETVDVFELPACLSVKVCVAPTTVAVIVFVLPIWSISKV